MQFLHASLTAVSDFNSILVMKLGIRMFVSNLSYITTQVLILTLLRPLPPAFVSSISSTQPLNLWLYCEELKTSRIINELSCALQRYESFSNKLISVTFTRMIELSAASHNYGLILCDLSISRLICGLNMPFLALVLMHIRLCNFLHAPPPPRSYSFFHV